MAIKRRKLENGKYVINTMDCGSVAVTRYGDFWRDITGDKFVGALVSRIEVMEQHIRHLTGNPDFDFDEAYKDE